MSFIKKLSPETHGLSYLNPPNFIFLFHSCFFSDASSYFDSSVTPTLMGRFFFRVFLSRNIFASPIKVDQFNNSVPFSSNSLIFDHYHLMHGLGPSFTILPSNICKIPDGFKSQCIFEIT